MQVRVCKIEQYGGAVAVDRERDTGIAGAGEVIGDEQALGSFRWRFDAAILTGRTLVLLYCWLSRLASAAASSRRVLSRRSATSARSRPMKARPKWGLLSQASRSWEASKARA